MLNEKNKSKIKQVSSKLFISDVLLKIGSLPAKKKDEYSEQLVGRLKSAYNCETVDFSNIKSLTLKVEFEKLHKNLLLLLLDEEVIFEVVKGDLKNLSERELFLKLAKNDLSDTLIVYYKSILNSISIIELYTVYGK